VEVEDKLPNIRYRIDNRWLFSDISDVLEPAVDDREFSSPEEFKTVLCKVFDDYQVEDEYRVDFEFNPRDRITLLLFKYETQKKGFVWIPIVMNNATRPVAGHIFNFFSQRMERFARRVHPETAFKMVKVDGIEVLSEEMNRKLIYNAMEAQELVKNGEASSAISNEYPWITFVSLRWCRTKNQLPNDLVDFTVDMVNRDIVLAQIAKGDYEDGFYLIKLPLPLANTIGRIITDFEFSQIRDIINHLTEIKSNCSHFEHRKEVNTLLNEAVWPLEIGLIETTVLIVRDNVDYFRELTK